MPQWLRLLLHNNITTVPQESRVLWHDIIVAQEAKFCWHKNITVPEEMSCVVTQDAAASKVLKTESLLV